MNDSYYVLVNREPIKEPDIMKWRKFMQSNERTVKVSNSGSIKVSTVFLGLDHSFDGIGLDIFETMIFGGENDGELARCSTWDNAVLLHKKACKEVGIDE